MGGCISLDDGSDDDVGCGTPHSSSSSCRRSRQKLSRRRVMQILAAEAKTNELLYRIEGRMCGNGSSSNACIFTQQGRKGINQDAMIVWENFDSSPDTAFCGVFDGHGPFGHLVARKVRDSLPTKIVAVRSDTKKASAITSALESSYPSTDELAQKWFGAWKDCFMKSYHAMDKDLKAHPTIDCFCSGTTAVTMLLQGKDMLVANVGDSRAVLGTLSADNAKVEAVQITVDLKPNLPLEAERIKRCKGRVFALEDEPEVARVWLPHDDSPGLAMARAFGDFCLKDFGLIAVPEITYTRITERDQFIVLASDGIWDVLSNQEVVDTIWEAPTRTTAARALVETAVRAWRLKYPTSKVDDCAVVCFFFNNHGTAQQLRQNLSVVSAVAKTVPLDMDTEEVVSGPASPATTMAMEDIKPFLLPESGNMFQRSDTLRSSAIAHQDAPVMSPSSDSAALATTTTMAAAAEEATEPANVSISKANGSDGSISSCSSEQHPPEWSMSSDSEGSERAISSSSSDSAAAPQPPDQLVSEMTQAEEEEGSSFGSERAVSCSSSDSAAAPQPPDQLVSEMTHAEEEEGSFGSEHAVSSSSSDSAAAPQPPHQLVSEMTHAEEEEEGSLIQMSSIDVKDALVRDCSRGEESEMPVDDEEANQVIGNDEQQVEKDAGMDAITGDKTEEVKCHTDAAAAHGGVQIVDEDDGHSLRREEAEPDAAIEECKEAEQQQMLDVGQEMSRCEACSREEEGGGDGEQEFEASKGGKELQMEGGRTEICREERAEGVDVVQSEAISSIRDYMEQEQRMVEAISSISDYMEQEQEQEKEQRMADNAGAAKQEEAAMWRRWGMAEKVGGTEAEEAESEITVATEDEEEEEEEEGSAKAMMVRSASRKSLAECLSVADDEEWSALEGVARVNSLLKLPRFLRVGGGGANAAEGGWKAAAPPEGEKKWWRRIRRRRRRRGGAAATVTEKRRRKWWRWL